MFTIFDTAALDTKWIRDMEDSQLSDGSLPDIAPAFWPFYTGSITFPTAALVMLCRNEDAPGAACDSGNITSSTASTQARIMNSIPSH